MPDQPIIPCRQRDDWPNVVEDYAARLQEAAHTIGSHGMSREEFEESGLFRSVVERLRGQQAASTKRKYDFVRLVLQRLQDAGEIKGFEYSGGGERHDFQVELHNRKVCVIEAKGCLDGNNTNIYQRPANADEFLIWSLCQNPGADPRHNAWSGIHTRLGAEVIHRREVVDGLIIWDMLCGTAARPCPKLIANAERATRLGKLSVPPPCIYLFPRTVPDARNNPKPRPWQLADQTFLSVLAGHFRSLTTEVVSVQLEVQHDKKNIQRRTTFEIDGVEVAQSRWTALRRAY